MVQYYIKEIRGEFIVRENIGKLIHSKFQSKKQALDKIKRLKEKDKKVKVVEKKKNIYLKILKIQNLKLMKLSHYLMKG